MTKLENVIENFSKENVENFFKQKRDFSYNPEDFSDTDTEKSKEYFETIEKIGEFNFVEEKEKVDIFVIKIKKELSGYRSGRKAQYDLSKEILKDNGLGAGIFFFYDKNGNFRVSLVYPSYLGTKENYNHFKRFQYLVEKDQTNKTFKKNIGDEKAFLSLNNIKEAFSVSKVTKEFFDSYKILYKKLIKEISEDNDFIDFAESHSVQVNDFAKKLMGQITFLYFIQRKKILGAKKEDKIYEGDEKFLRSLFEKYKIEKKTNKDEDFNFFNNFLEYIFYDSLNKKTEDGSHFREKFNSKIPYLNGGLFEPIENYKWKDNFLKISDDIFSNKKEDGILDVFDSYNFTIDENSSDDIEVSIDPEMLGRVFENLLAEENPETGESARKSKGAFYTPREIVDYMVKESLIQYLKTNTKVSEEKIVSLIQNHKIEEENIVEEELEDIDENLKKIKIVDPAVGSGAFPVAILQELSSVRYFLNKKTSGNSKTIYKLKEKILGENIYGVDIDPGAVDIARLRFWLSMIVDLNPKKEDINPLPNLDFKIMQGNSLLNDLHIAGEVIKIKLGNKKILDRRTKQAKMFDDGIEEVEQGILGFAIDNSENISENWVRLHNEYYLTKNSEDKKTIKKKLDFVEDDLIVAGHGEAISNIQSQIKNETNESKKEQLEKKLKEVKNGLEKWKKDKIRPFFSWRLHFYEVFDKGGFDIVIGNPPYIQLQKNEGFLANQLEGAGYETFMRSGDIYGLFYEFGNNILNSTGHLAFITSNKWMRAGYGEKLRNYLSKNTTPKVLLDLGPGVFETATVDTNILLFQKNKSEKVSCLSCDVKVDLVKENINLEKYIKDNSIEVKRFSSEAWTIIKPIEEKIKNKIEKIGTPLKDWSVRIYRGLVTGDNKGLVLSRSEYLAFLRINDPIVKYIKPYLFGKNIFRYNYILTKYLISIPKNTILTSEELLSILDIDNNNNQSISKRSEKGSYWYDLRGCSFYNLFDEEILVWSDIADKPNFTLVENTQIDTSAYFLHNTSNLENKYLLGLLNSSTAFYYMKLSASALGGDAIRWKKLFVEKIPIYQISKEYQRPFIFLVDEVLKITSSVRYDPKKPPVEKKELEKKIDEMVMDLYELTEEEKEIVRKS